MKGKPLLAGAAAGLIAGAVMGVMIIVMMGGTQDGTINKIAALYGGQSAALGFGAHLIHSALIGALFGLLFKSYARSKISATIAGLVYGFIWWILGPLFIMPLWLAGAGFMGLVVVKLYLVDLGNSGTVERIVSFIGVGMLLLVVGYFAPVPPRYGHQDATPPGDAPPAPGAATGDGP